MNGFSKLVSSLLLLLSTALYAEIRLPLKIDSTSTVPLAHSVHPLAHTRDDQGAVDDNYVLESLQLVLSPTPQQSRDLDAYIAELNTPGSTHYHDWLTPQQFGQRFGLSIADVSNLTGWLRSQGFTGIRVANSQLRISFSGNVATIRKAFGVQIHTIVSNGETHYANLTAPVVPASVASVVSEIKGLNNFRARSFATMPAAQKQLKAMYTDTSSHHYIAPGDIATMYNLNALYSLGVDGTGLKIAVLGQTDIDLADIRAYKTLFGLASNDPQVVVVGTDPGLSATDLVEADLDLELVGAAAPGAQVIYVNSKGVDISLQYAVDNAVAPIISVSYGSPEALSTNNELVAKQAAAEGISIIAASGDWGAAGCDYDKSAPALATGGLCVMNYANLPEVTGIGGTSFLSDTVANWSTTNGTQGGTLLAYETETSWNTQQLMASGGGVSTVFSKPYWQAGTGVPSDGQRDVPDVALFSMSGSTAYLICTNGTCSSGLQAAVDSGKSVWGGSSASTPVFAGVMALVEQYQLKQGYISQAGLGNLNPKLYLLARDNGSVFHDVTTGNNKVACKVGTTDCSTGTLGYDAGVGYDLVTGLGSVDAYNLAFTWNSSQYASTQTTASTSAQSVIYGSSVTLTASVTSSAGQVDGAVTFYDGAVSLGSKSIQNGSASIDISSLSVGSHAISVVFAGSFGYSPSTSSTVTVTVAAQPLPVPTVTLTADQASIIQGSSITFTAKVAAASGNAVPTGTVTFYNASTNLGTSTLTSGSGSLTTTALPTGTASVTAVYSGDTSFATATSAAVSVTVTQPAADFNITSSKTSITVTGGDTATTTLTISPQNGFTGTVSLSCAGLPSGATCTFGTPTTTNGVTSVSLAIATKKLTSTMQPVLAILPCLGLFAVSRRRRLVKMLHLLVLILMVGASIGAIGCGSSNAGSSSSGSGTGSTGGSTSSQTSTVTVTATSGSITHQIQISLTVQ